MGSPLVRLGALAAVWGCSFLFIKVGLEGLSPVQIALVRIVSGAAVLGAILAVRGERLPRSPVTWAHLGFMGLLANVVPFSLFGYGEQRVDSLLAGIYNATTPLMTVFVALALLPAERLTRAKLTGIVLGFLGVVVVLAPWSGVGEAALSGQLACLGAAACYGVSIPWTRRYLSGLGHPPLVLATGQLGAAAVVMLLGAPVLADDRVDLTPAVVGSVLALGVVGTGLAYLLYFGLIRDLGATGASTVTYLVPLVAVALGVLVLDESISWHEPVGGLVVVLGIAVSEGRLGRRRRPAADVLAGDAGRG